MKNIGIISEFNPFHNGHKLLIDYARDQLYADNIIIIMSGSFVQRGEPAIFDKWSRAKMCLYAGADIVVELPALFASSSAEFFSMASISLLNSLNCITDIVFGAENDDLTVLGKYASLFIDEPENFKYLLKSELADGVSFPVARARATSMYMGTSSDVLNSPNNILAVEYLKALIKSGSKIVPHAYKRKYAPYHSTNISSSIASATAIRRAIKDNSSIESVVPCETFSIVSDLIQRGMGPCYYDSLSDLLHYTLRMSDAEHISNILDVTEGLENRILHYSNNIYLISDLVNKIKNKRYAFSKIQRALLHIILNITDELFLANKNKPRYVRVLGFKKNSTILKTITKSSELPVIINIAKDMCRLDKNAKNLLDIDFRATDIFTISFVNKKYSKSKLDLTTPVVVI